MCKGHLLTDFVLSTQLCSFLILGLSHEGTQQARPLSWLTLCIPRRCQAEEPGEQGPSLPSLCAPHFQVSIGRVGRVALGGLGGVSQLV